MVDTRTTASAYSKIERLLRAATPAMRSNPRTRGLMSSPPTVTADGTTLPGTQTKAYARLSFLDIFTPIGGQFVVGASTGGRVKSAKIAATGGNLSLNDGSEGSYSRIPIMSDAAKVTFGVGPTTAKYRFIVDGQYIDKTGTQTVATTGSTAEYISLDFGAAKPEGREIMIEMWGTGRFLGVYVGASARVWRPDASAPSAVLLLDSYGNGSSCVHLGDGIGAVMGDYLGVRQHNSGSGGTGWINDAAGAAYTFGQRIANGDLGLAGTPDLIVMGGSYNDRTYLAADITAAVLAGLIATRALYPKAPIAVLGGFPGNTGPSAAIIAAENAVSAAVTAFGDPFTFFAPISTAPDTWISGTGKIGTTTGTGNSDIYTDSGGVHMPEVGHSYAGQRAAAAITAGLRGLLA